MNLTSPLSHESSVLNPSLFPGKEGAQEDQEKQASRSESYFKMQNVHGKGAGKDEKRYTRRPSYSSSSPASSSSSSGSTSPASTASLTQEPKNHRAESGRTKLRDVTGDNQKTYPKIKHFESDFRPIEGPTTEEPKRPQRLVNHHYNPHHHESEEDVSTSLASSQEIYRKEPKYRDYDHASGEVFHSSEQYSEESTPKYKAYKDEKKPTSYRNSDYSKPIRGNYKHYTEASSHQTPDYKHYTEASDHKTPDYKHYTETSNYKTPDYSTIFKSSPSSDSGSQKQYANYYKHSPSDFRGQKDYSSFYKNSPPSDTHNHKDYSSVFKSSVKHATPTPPQGMSEELMETLLQQEPQKFSDGGQVKSAYSYPSKKKFKSADSPTTFNVGYSIGFGGPPSDDVILGKPKDAGLKIHVNGEKSIWKQLNNGVEMSHSVDKAKPIQFRIPNTSPRPKINVLKNGGSSVYYMNNNSPDIDTIPTAGKSTFDHNQALTRLTQFDFSNAVPGPIALPLQSLHSHISPEVQPYPLKTKSGRNLDIMSLYQSMGYTPPIPVLIPSGPKGEAQMVHAIVIPLQSLPNADFGWGQLSGMFAPNGIVTPSASQPVQFSPVMPINHNSISHNSINQNSVHPNGPPYKTHHSININHHPVSNPFPAIPEKIRIPKYRKAKDAFKSASAFSSPIVVHPVHNDQKDRQKELNAILAQEMSRKNQRQPPLGLRPPPPQ